MRKLFYIRYLKIILWVYITLCILIAGLNYGFSSKVSPSFSSFITSFWEFYENWVKTIFIIICSFLTIKIISSSSRSKMRKRNMIGFIATASIIHIILPLVFNNKEIYFFAMPLPWSTTPLQLLDRGSDFYLSHYKLWGITGISVVLTLYLCISIIVFVGTLLFGRRLQCSTLCLFNGFASEVFSPAIPLIGKPKKVNIKLIKLFSVLRWIFLAIALFFTLYWTLRVFKVPLIGDTGIIRKLELYKYLITELLMAMFFWVAFIGRGYCFYCPLGTVLGLLGKIAGQKILTNNSKCIGCNKCNIACPMSIDIMNKAKNGEFVTDLKCVGCGHCIDSCPIQTLSYSTRFIRFYKKLDHLIHFSEPNNQHTKIKIR